MPDENAKNDSSYAMRALRPSGGDGRSTLRPWRRFLSWLLRVGSVALAAWLLHLTISRTDADLRGALRGAALWPLLAALALLGATHAIGAWRWLYLLRVQNIHLSYFLGLRLTIIGHFFCSVVPGGAGGDLLKMGYVLKYSGGREIEAVLSIIVDRILGLAGLILIGNAASVYMLVYHHELIFAQPILAITIAIIAAAAFALLALYALLLLRAPLLRWRPCAALANWAAQRLPAAILDIIGKLVSGLELYRQRPDALLHALGLSVIVHFILAAALYCIGRACSEAQMGFIHYLLSTQIGNVAALIPLTPGGIGMRDAVTAALFLAFNPQSSNIIGSIPVINSLLTLIWAAVGAAIFSLSPQFRKRTPASR
jgi:uncharacterized protein (TIRG00374 family)